jgi:hypothetical protein
MDLNIIKIARCAHLLKLQYLDLQELPGRKQKVLLHS